MRLSPPSSPARYADVAGVESAAFVGVDAYYLCAIRIDAICLMAEMLCEITARASPEGAKAAR